jgi:hypothetical protein
MIAIIWNSYCQMYDEQAYSRDAILLLITESQLPYGFWLDFKVPQRDRWTAVLDISLGIRGYKVHFLRNAWKVSAKKYIRNHEWRSIEILLYITCKKPDLGSVSDVFFAYELLRGEHPFPKE